MRIFTRRIEKADEPVFECSCCGKMHRKVHHMSNGATMGQTCAQMVDRLSYWANPKELEDPRNAVQVAYLKRVGALP